MKISTPLNLFTIELQDLYSAETQIVEALPALVKAANNKKLKAGFEAHLMETKQHVKRLVKVAKLMGVEVEGKTCDGMKGLLKEGDEVTKLKGAEVLLDEALMSGARKVEHYEVLGYTSLIMLAKQMKQKEVVQILNETLGEEEATDKKLEQLAKSPEATEAMSQLDNEEK